MKYSVGLPVSNGRDRVNCAHAQIAWPHTKWMLASPGRISNQSCLRCVEMDNSAQRKLHNLYAMQAVCCPWWRHNQFEEPSSHEASCDVRTMISLRVTRRVNLKPFFQSAEIRGSSSLYSHCSTTVIWLTDSYDKQLTGLAFACRFTALVN